jgi:hypothetical protein
MTVKWGFTRTPKHCEKQDVNQLFTLFTGGAELTKRGEKARTTPFNEA